jgi:FADH2 O2-dependent halogenase
VSDEQSDTNWLRADFDSFVANKAKEAGITYYDLTEIVSAQKTEQWLFEAIQANKSVQLQASFFIDATGGGNLLEKIANIPSQSDEFLTDSYGVFSHFTNVPRWVDMLHGKNIPTDDFPYDPDHSALHQLLDEGWIWMLRFKTDLISIGFALNGQEKEVAGMGAEETWKYMCERYPSVNEMLKGAVLANQPGKILKSSRLQRKLANCFGDGWVALPHTCGFVDPLFSSGIAHSLAGVEKVVATLQQCWGNERLLEERLHDYETAIFAELKLTDMLVAGCYKTMKHFPLFNAWSMLYFAATITYEQRRLRGEKPGYFLSADDAYVLQIVQQSYADLTAILQKDQPTPEDEQHFTKIIRERIKPINNAGLMEPASKNIYRHTTAVL